jgi:hypothetical protein
VLSNEESVRIILMDDSFEKGYYCRAPQPPGPIPGKLLIKACPSPPWARRLLMGITAFTLWRKSWSNNLASENILSNRSGGMEALPVTLVPRF